MGLLFFAGWDSKVYLYPSLVPLALVPIGFYMFAGAWLILRK